MAFDLKLAGFIGITLIALSGNSFGQQSGTALSKAKVTPQRKLMCRGRLLN